MKRRREGGETLKHTHTQRMETRKADKMAEKEIPLVMSGEKSRDNKKIGRRKLAHTSLESGKKETKILAPNKCLKYPSRNLPRAL